MKALLNPRLFTMALLAVSLAFSTTSCGKKKKAAEAAPPAGETLIKQYCAGEQYFSDKNFFRANNLGESADQATAKKRAFSNARADLASSVNTTIRAVVDNYVNSREFNNREEIEERFEGLSREIIDQQLNGVKTICEEVVMVNSTGKYKYYIAIELSGQDMVAAFSDRVSKDERLQIDYDYQQFRETFEREMDRMENSRP